MRKVASADNRSIPSEIWTNTLKKKTIFPVLDWLRAVNFACESRDEFRACTIEN